jgi:hypothetical protein
VFVLVRTPNDKQFPASIYYHDFGNKIVGYKKGRPFYVELGFNPNIKKLDYYLNSVLKLEIDPNEMINWNLQ